MKGLFLIPLVLGLMLGLILGGCAKPAPEPAAAPAPVPPTTPVDNPSLSADEVCAYVWDHLPNDLPEGYKKDQFSPRTRGALYEGNGKWIFEVFGSGIDIVPLPTNVCEKPDVHYWVEEYRKEVTKYELKLSANLYEKTMELEILVIDKFNIKTDTQVSETRLWPELLVNYVIVYYEGYFCTFEGGVTNSGKIPVEVVQVEISLYDADRNFVAKQITTLDPSTIEPGEKAYFALQWKQEKAYRLKTYGFSFISASGERIHFEVE